MIHATASLIEPLAHIRKQSLKDQRLSGLMHTIDIQAFSESHHNQHQINQNVLLSLQ